MRVNKVNVIVRYTKVIGKWFNGNLTSDTRVQSVLVWKVQSSYKARITQERGKQNYSTKVKFGSDSIRQSITIHIIARDSTYA